MEYIVNVERVNMYEITFTCEGKRSKVNTANAVNVPLGVYEIESEHPRETFMFNMDVKKFFMALKLVSKVEEIKPIKKASFWDRLKG